MRLRNASYLLLALVAAPAFAAPPIEPTPPFVFPIAPTIAPKATTDPIVIAPGEVYVFTREAEFRAFDSPRDVLHVKTKKLKAGHTYTVFGRFVGSNGALEEREYVGTDKGLTIAIVTAKRDRDGDAELILVPTGGDEDWEVRLAFAVRSGKPRPPPVPPVPQPPDPPVPVPVPNVDAVLVAKFKNALATDIANNAGTKEKAADLAVVFESGAGLLDIGDPAIAPRTVGELTTKMVNASVAKGIPRPPYLKNVRAVVEAHTPLLNGLTELTPTIKAEFQTKYRAVAVALAEASK